LGLYSRREFRLSVLPAEGASGPQHHESIVAMQFFHGVISRQTVQPSVRLRAARVPGVRVSDGVGAVGTGMRGRNRTRTWSHYPGLQIAAEGTIRTPFKIGAAFDLATVNVRCPLARSLSESTTAFAIPESAAGGRAVPVGGGSRKGDIIEPVEQRRWKEPN
jgi:hypothetical protein